MTRIISGLAGGRRIHTPPGSGTRPTSDRVREALFSRLEHLDVVNHAVCDLYTRSRTLGLERLPQAREAVLLVEDPNAAPQWSARTSPSWSCPGSARPGRHRERASPRSSRETCHVIWSSRPPYDLTEEALADAPHPLVAHGWLQR